MKLTLLVAVAIVAPSCYDAYLPAPKPNGCTKDGRFFPYGKFEDHSDHCNECECFQDGNYKCSKRACPAANCPVEKMKYRPGSCCAECFDHRSKTSDSNSDSDHHTSYDKNTRNRRTLENTPDEESSGSTTSESYNAAVGRRRFARTIVYKPGSRTSDQHGSSSSSDGKGHTGGKGSGRSGSKSSHSSKSGKGGKSSRSSGGHTSKSSGDNRPEGYNRARRSLNIDDKADVRRFVRTIVYKPGSRTSDNHGSSSSSDGHNGGKGSGRSGSKSSHSSKSGKGGKSSESSEGHTSKSSSDYRPEGYNRARRSVNIDDEADVRRFVRTIVYNPGSRTSDHHGSSSSSDGKGLKGSGRSGSKSKPQF
ncbi:hornerin-like [Dreissena polymorpha]|uniref:hornerin-like n=1 Tax=Dreissena polymorpha TaxID=45954 RepID=UPI0022654661|nr:hornerin-like [Dreissena polymorpha]